MGLKAWVGGGESQGSPQNRNSREYSWKDSGQQQVFVGGQSGWRGGDGPPFRGKDFELCPVGEESKSHGWGVAPEGF